MVEQALATVTVPNPTRRSDALALVRLGRKAATAYARPDLAERLDGHIDRLEGRRVTVVVIGEYKAGKSSLVNALVAADVCPVDVDVATAVPTVIEYADSPTVEVMRIEDGVATAFAVAPGDAASWIRGEHAGAVSVRVGLPRRLLDGGVVLVDTPGVGGLDARRVAQSLGILSTADAVLFVTDGANELGGPALELLALVRGLVPTTELVLTKADLSHHVDEVAEANREHLRHAGLDVSVSVISAELRSSALATNDPELDEESGIPSLLSRLRAVGANADHNAVVSATAAVADVSAQLREVFVAERNTIVAGPSAVTAAQPASTQAAGSWQQLLGDEVTDFSSDLEFELRRRARELMTEADAALADGDPDELWNEVSVWLAERAAADVVATFSALRDRTTLIATRVAERFDLSLEGAAPVNPNTLDDLVRQVLVSLPERAAIGTAANNKTTSGLNAFRSTFYAFTMFSTVGALVGIAVAPAALALGLVIGGKSVRDERVRGRQQRRTQAKAAVRTYVDEVAFIAGKESRDALRLVQRALRDHFTALAAERQRTNAEIAAAAKRAAEADVQERRRRLADVDTELGRLDALTARTDALVASLNVASPTGGLA